MAKAIWERHNFTNHDIGIIINSEIIEYDIRSAGLSLAKEFGYLDKFTISKLENMTKSERNRRIGIMKISNKQLSKKENECLVKVRELFIKSNNLNVEDIIAIKKDAIFVTKRCNNRKFGEVEFVPKNSYTSYMELNGLEFYYSSNNMDIKGVNDNMIKLHENYMLDFFINYIELLEKGNDKKLIDYVTYFVYKYKSKSLDVEYYREFNASSNFRLKGIVENNMYGIDTIDSSGIEEIDIHYNYFNYLVPLCTRLM